MQENNARHAGETHNNNSTAFNAPSFTCTGMKIFWVKNGKCAFPTRKVTLFGASGHDPCLASPSIIFNRFKVFNSNNKND